MELYYNLAKLILRIYQGILLQDCQVSGELPLGPGPKIIAPNHPNATDGFFLPFILHEKLYFIIQGDMFWIPFFGWLLARSGQIPVWPDQKKAALDQASDLLANGKTVVIFPEGQLNPNRKPVKPGTGAVRLSLMTGAAIIPVGFYVPAQHLYNLTVRKNGELGHSLWQTGGRCYIQIGSPWLPGLQGCKEADKTAVRELTDRLMERIDALADQAALECIQEMKLMNKSGNKAFND